jgi:hypothetical protein
MFSKVQSKNPEVKIITGRFDVAVSTGAATKLAGLGYSVAKSATGEYTITFPENYSHLISAVAIPEVDGVNVAAQIKSCSATSVVIKLVKTVATIAETTITVAEAAYDGACKVHFVINLQRTSLPAV